MKALKKLALVSAVSMISAGAFAMEAMDDESMASATGQDGISILVKPGVLSAAQLTTFGVSAASQDLVDNPSLGYFANNDDSFNGLSINRVVIHDNDGWTAAFGGTAGTTDNSGVLVIGDGSAGDSTVLFADGSKPIKIDVDMVGDHNGATAGGAAMLNVRITTPRLGIKVGSIGVADSYNKGADGVDDSSAVAIGTALANDDVDNAGATDGNAYRGRVTIMNGMEIVMGAAVTNIQLGAESQGAMIVLNTSLLGGLAINNFSLNDTAGNINTVPLGTVITGGGSIFVGSLTMKDAGGSNLTVAANVDVGSTSTATYAAVPAQQSALRDRVAVAAFGTGSTYAALTAPQQAAVDAQITGPGGIEDQAQAAYNGLVIQVAQLGDATNGADLSMNNIRLGDATAANLGDVQILGLNINGTTLVISGH